MKTFPFSLLVLLASATVLDAQRPPQARPPAPPPPPPVSSVFPQPASSEVYIYEQKPMAGRPYLVTPEQAQTVINRFKEAYGQLGNPRLLIFVNRELVDEEAGLKLSARKEQTESIRNEGSRVSPPGATNATNITAAGPGRTDRVTNQNTYRVRERQQSSLADRQTARDVERLFGRPLRLAGAALVDQRIATQLLDGKPIETFMTSTEGEQARKDREAILKIADVVVEVLISSRNVTVTELSGDKVYAVPDIQATAIRLNDARIVGQATAADIVGQGRAAGRTARSFDVREITEATALSLMEDMMLQ